MYKKQFSVSRFLLVFLSIYCLTFAFAISADTNSAVTTHLTILYDNDIHGHLLPFDDSRSGKDIGGAARRTYLIKKLKSENPNNLVLDAGDLLSGTPISGFFKGEADFGTFERMPYDAVAIGNHDFDYSQATLRHFIKTSPIPVLSANIFEEDNSLFAKPYIIKKVAGLKIAIIGLTTPSTPITTQPKNVIGLHFGEPDVVLGGYMPELKKQADLIIAVTHIGFSEDKELAEKVPGIDVIVGGHSHTKVDGYVKSGNTIVVQDFFAGIYLGKLDLTIVNKKIVDQQAELIPINSSIPDDPAIAAYLKPFADQITGKMNEVVGKTDVDLRKPSYTDSQTNLGDWLCDVFRERAHADIAMQNTGGIRASLNKGTLTYNDIYSVLPFENALVVLEADGTLMQEILDNLAGKIQHASETGCVSGVTFTVSNGKATNIMIGGKPLDLSKKYTIATNDFMASGGSGYAPLKKAKFLRNEGVLRDIVIDYLKTHSPIAPVAEERFTVGN